MNMNKRLQEYASEDARKRLKEEQSRLQTLLNQSFVEFCSKADRLAPWTGAARDYQIHSSDIAQRTYQGLSANEGGALYTFGSGDCGQLGHGVSDPPVEEEETSVEFPKRVAAFSSSKDMRLLKAGGLSNAMVDSRGVWTWGCADDGALGRDGDENLPALVHFSSKVVITALSLGDCHGACVALSGQSFLWGSYRDKDGKTFFPTSATANGNGKESGPGTVAKQPAELNGLSNIISCASGANHTIFLSSEGEVFSLGFGDQNQLGRDVSTKFKIPNPADKDDEIYDVRMIHREHLIPKKVSLRQPARAIGSGAYHTFIISSVECEVYGCGLNQFQQVIEDKPSFESIAANPQKASTGVMTVESVKLTKIPSLDGKDIVSIQGGEHYSLAIGMDGSVYTWGRSDQGQLGRPSSEAAGAWSAVPTKVAGLPPVAQAYCGSSHVIARTRSGDVFTWGFGEMLQLGHGENSLNSSGRLDQMTPKKVERLSKLTAVNVSAGAQHSCVLVSGPR